MKVKLYTSIDGNVTISRLGSFLAWRKSSLEAVPRDENGICKVCGGVGSVRTQRYGLMNCICTVMDETRVLSEILKGVRSPVIPQAIEDIEEWGNHFSRSDIHKAIVLLEKWVDWPSTWVTITGGTGCGKSHMLSWIAGTFGPWALYITATDFEDNLRQLMATKSEDGDPVSEYLEQIKLAPILLFDDLGSEYVSAGRDWVRSCLRRVIDYRYLMPEEYITVVTTNLAEQFVMDYDKRIGSRIFDRQITNIITLSNVGDYRRRTE